MSAEQRSPFQNESATQVNLPGRSIRDVFETLWRYRRRSLIFFVSSMTLIVIGLILCPRKYTSDARLFVRIGRESIALDPTVTTGKFMGLETSREPEINSLLEVFNSRKIMERVVDETGFGEAYADPMKREKAIVKLQKKLKTWSPKKSNVIGVRFESDSPENSQRIVNTVVDIFLQEHLRVNSTPGSYEFFNEQAAAIKEDLDAALSELRDAKIQFGIGSVDGRRKTLQGQIGDTETHLIENASKLSAVRAKIAELQNGLDTLPSGVVRQFVKGLPADAENNMREQLYNLQTREQELLAKYTEHHPHVVAIREQVLGAERILGSEKPNRGQATSAVLLTELANEKSLVAERDSLAEHVQRLQREASSLNRHEVKIVELRRQVKLLEAKYTTYTQNLDQARIDRELKKDEITNISVIQPASLVLKPSTPKNGLTLALGFAFSLLGAIAVTFVSDNLAKTARPATTSTTDHQIENPVTDEQVPNDQVVPVLVGSSYTPVAPSPSAT